MFRILGSVDALNEKLGIQLTHHDMNWVYSCQKGADGRWRGRGYYLKTSVPAVRLISCLLETNKCMDEDFLIVLGEWHNGLNCPTKDGTLGGMALGHLTKISVSLGNYNILFTCHFIVLPLYMYICLLLA